LERLRSHRAILVDGPKDDLNRVPRPADLLARISPIEQRHGHVRSHYLRMEAKYRIDEGMAVADYSHNLELRFQ